VRSFVHVNARSVAEATGYLARYGGKAGLNAGGTDLLGVLKDRILPGYPEAVVNIKTIPGLAAIEDGEEAIRIGALATLADIAGSPVIQEHLPVLREAARSVASPQIRNMATLGGNLAQDTRCWYYRYPDRIGGRIGCFRKGGKTCPAAAGENRYHALFGARRCHAVCPSDTAVALAALGARLDIAGAGGGRELPVAEFYTPLGNALAVDEMVTAVHIPKPPSGAGQAFLKFTLRKPIDFAVVSVAAVVTRRDGVCTGARLVLGAVAPTPWPATAAEEFLQGKELTGDTAARAADIALAGARPLARNAYKVEIARTLVKRAVLACSREE